MFPISIRRRGKINSTYREGLKLHEVRYGGKLTRKKSLNY